MMSATMTAWVPLHRAALPLCRASSQAEDEWRIKRQTLVRSQVRSIHVSEARRLQQDQGYVIIDVRPKEEFKEAYPPGAVNVELYRLIKEWTPWDIARRIGFALFGIMQGTEENPAFLDDVKLNVEGKDSPVIVTCAMGGTTKSTSSLPEGKESRSLVAAYLMVLDGYTKVSHLEGGVRAWYREGLPIVQASE